MRSVRESKNPTKLLCISGSGRSGTTILSVLLSQGADVFNLGQSRDFWASYGDRAPCTCGKLMDQCDVWSNVVKAGFDRSTVGEVRQVRTAARSFYADAARLGAWREPDELQDLAHRHRSYLDQLARFLFALRDITGCAIFVDSSKTPEAGLGYSLLAGVEVHVVNLVRDPRAVLCSWNKKLGDAQKALRYGDVWIERQRRLEGWGEALGPRYRMLSYETLVRRPQSEVAKLLDWIGAEPNSDLFTGPRQATVSWQRQHLFPPANERVLSERLSSVEIAAPVEWKSPANWGLHWRALRRTHPLGLRHVLNSTLGRY